jgi:hypothetical protein
MQGEGNVDVARAMVFLLRASWCAAAAASEGKASRAHAPAVKATVRWRHRGSRQPTQDSESECGREVCEGQCAARSMVARTA